MSVSARTYSGCYGGETSNNGDIIITTIECPVHTPALIQKQIIFVVDESGSMCDTMPSVRASLFAARNSLLRLTGIDLSKLNEEQRDVAFSETCNSCLITFSDEARCRWESNKAIQLQREGVNTSEVAGETKIFPMEHVSPVLSTNITFSEVVNKISSDASTNMGGAIQMAFDRKLPDCATWIILLTDGVSNKGPCQTASGFQNLMQNIPSHTKIIPLGYTTNFDPEILSILGNMTYVETEENIAEIFGSITAEIVTCFGIDAKILLPSLGSDMVSPDDLIVVPDLIGDAPRDIIGGSDLGCMFNDRKFMYGYLPWGNVRKPEFSQYIGLQGKISYHDILWKTEVTIPFTISDGGETAPDTVYENYFASSKSRILLGIYQARKNGKFPNQYRNLILAKIEDWKHPTAQSHKEELLRIISVRNPTCNDDITICSHASNGRSQTTYIGTETYITPTQRVASAACSTDATFYSSLGRSNDPNKQSTVIIQPNNARIPATPYMMPN